MIGALLLLFSLGSFAEAPVHWNSALKITERHEFYLDNSVIEKPQDSWQVLFSVVYPDAHLSLQKDCVFFRVPGEKPGELKIKKLAETTPCETELFQTGDREWKNIKTLEFSTAKGGISLSMTFPQYKSEVWKLSLSNHSPRPKPTLNMSSAEYKSPKMILLAPGTRVGDVKKNFALKEGDICHAVSDDCDAKPSLCHECPGPWYELPNGCVDGPKACGTLECGKKNSVACRRGFDWQGEKKQLSCRGDSSFAYCSPGLKIQCEGAIAYCR